MNEFAQNIKHDLWKCWWNLDRAPEALLERKLRQGLTTTFRASLNQSLAVTLTYSFQHEISRILEIY